jgi:hypothetical protein
MDSESLAEDIGKLLKGAPSGRDSQATVVSVTDSDIG